MENPQTSFDTYYCKDRWCVPYPKGEKIDRHSHPYLRVCCKTLSLYVSINLNRAGKKLHLKGNQKLLRLFMQYFPLIAMFCNQSNI